MNSIDSSDSDTAHNKGNSSFNEHDPNSNEKKGAINFNLFVIKKNSSWKGVFDFVMLFVSCQNIFSNSYYSAFGIPSTQTF
jgi:hypothetical protein